ncbi:MAG: hypothetical protein U9P82_03810 [Bacteroidota bacterium]|nr:hypothetical protein [Bacteroidota bacterium]
MKKKIALILSIVIIVTICLSCSITQKCPAYAENNTVIEQNG